MKIFINIILTFSIFSTLAQETDSVKIAINGKPTITVKGDVEMIDENYIDEVIEALIDLKSDSLKLSSPENHKDWPFKKKIKINLKNIEIILSPEELKGLSDEDFANIIKEKKIVFEDYPTHQLSFNIELGLNNWLDDNSFSENTPYAIKPFGSWNVGFNFINKNKIFHFMIINWGFGINMSNWKLQDPNYTITKTPSQVAFNRLSPDLHGKKSKLMATYATAQFVPMFHFSKRKKKEIIITGKGIQIKRNSFKKEGFRIGVGLQAGYRLGSHSKIVYTEDGDKERSKVRSSFYLRTFRYGIRANIGWKAMDLFFNYDLNDLFEANNAPTGSNGIRAISFGIII